MTGPERRTRGPRALGLLASLLLAPPDAHGQGRDSVLVEVRLEGVGATLVIASPSADTTGYHFPTAPIFQLAGLEPPPVATASLGELQEILHVDVHWYPRRLQLVLRDPLQLLPASRRRLDQLRATAAAQAAAPYAARRTGPFGGITVDDRQAALVDLGYTLGPVFGRIAHSTESGTAWSAGATPVPWLWLAYTPSSRQEARMSARLALERTWVSAEYQAGRVNVDGASAFGPLVVYASSRDRFAVTWRGDVDVQLGHARDRSALRVSFGPVDPSPVSIPLVR